ncbi:poly(ADP-ribose) glycohydrolase-like [Babylonia areolata]|uniref:poly(ADP-ribose) glycohydrolase-like n=1 Tax=Babylonia areolata TaxID=304850 RepID=UPI003FD494C6
MPGTGAKSRRGKATDQRKHQPGASSASAKPKGKQSETGRPGAASAGTVQPSSVVPEGRKSAPASTVKGRSSTSQSTKTSADTANKANKRKMAEPMDWQSSGQELISNKSAFDMNAFVGTDSKPTSPDDKMEPPQTGDGGHADKVQQQYVDKAHAELTPSGAGGEGHRDESSDSQHSDSDRDDDFDMEAEEQTNKPRRHDPNQPWKGVPLDKLKTTPRCLPRTLKLERSRDHCIGVRTPFQYKADTIPAPCLAGGKWDADHVRMPFAYESKCTTDGKEQKRWDVIVSALNRPIPGPYELEEAILKYNQRYINKWKFLVLRHYFTKHISSEDRDLFFEHILPRMIELTLRLPDICPFAIPLLKRGKAKKLTLSQHQISSLLANAFFCTFPLRNSRTRASEYSDYPDINFSHLFTGDPVQRKLQKLQCIVHYFKRVLFKSPTGIVTFSRQMLVDSHKWASSMDNLTQLHVSSTGTIEDNGRGMLQVDFANKYLGGGVLGHGCVQEEIRFAICPEMIITRLFTQSLDHMESLVMTGCERYSEYEGYSDTFRWKDDCQDPTERDELGRLCCEVVAIDAQVFRSDYYKQFKRSCIERELNKAYCGFRTSANEADRAAVCTGNWGCGAFGGDKQLKALIQVMAASVAKRDVCYFTFGDEQLTKDLFELHDQLRRKEKTVGDLFCMLEDYNSRVVLPGHRSPSLPLFHFIHRQLDRDKGVRRQWGDARSHHDASPGRTWFD